MMHDDLIPKVQRMRALIRIGRERLTRHSPIWALFLARETFRALEETLDEIECPADSGEAREASGTLSRAS